MALYIGFILLVFLSPIYLAINMNRRRIRLLGLFAPVVFTLCMLKVLESNIRIPESGALEAGILMFLYGFPLIIGSLIFTLIRLCFVYQKKIWKALLIFISYILGPLLVGALAIYVELVFQIDHFIYVVIFSMILAPIFLLSISIFSTEISRTQLEGEKIWII